MLWLEIAMTSVAGLVTLMVLVHRKRPVDVHALGSVSHRWIAAHLVDYGPPPVGRPSGRPS
jgi:hypothetical protein